MVSEQPSVRAWPQMISCEEVLAWSARRAYGVCVTAGKSEEQAEDSMER